MSAAALEGAAGDLRRVQQKQRVCEASTEASAERLIAQLREALACAEGSGDATVAFEVLREQIKHHHRFERILKDTKEYHGSIARMGKVRASTGRGTSAAPGSA